MNAGIPTKSFSHIILGRDDSGLYQSGSSNGDEKGEFYFNRAPRFIDGLK